MRSEQGSAKPKKKKEEWIRWGKRCGAPYSLFLFVIKGYEHTQTHVSSLQIIDDSSGEKKDLEWRVKQMGI